MKGSQTYNANNKIVPESICLATPSTLSTPLLITPSTITISSFPKVEHNATPFKRYISFLEDKLVNSLSEPGQGPIMPCDTDYKPNSISIDNSEYARHINDTSFAAAASIYTKLEAVQQSLRDLE